MIVKSILSNVVIFAFGAAIGSVVTWKLLKTKYEQIAQEEIDSVKEVFSRKREETEPKEKPKGSSMTYTDYLKQIEPYTQVFNKKEEVPDVDKPYVITPEEFGELDEYDAISLNYYADGVLTNDWDELIENVDDVVGIDSLTHFGEYEDDSVFVRNDRLKADYEILRDSRNYSDVVDSSPHSSEE